MKTWLTGQSLYLTWPKGFVVLFTGKSKGWNLLLKLLLSLTLLFIFSFFTYRGIRWNSVKINTSILHRCACILRDREGVSKKQFTFLIPMIVLLVHNSSALSNKNFFWLQKFGPINILNKRKLRPTFRHYFGQ